MNFAIFFLLEEFFAEMDLWILVLSVVTKLKLSVAAKNVLESQMHSA